MRREGTYFELTDRFLSALLFSLPFPQAGGQVIAWRGGENVVICARRVANPLAVPPPAAAACCWEFCCASASTQSFVVRIHRPSWVWFGATEWDCGMEMQGLHQEESIINSFFAFRRSGGGYSALTIPNANERAEPNWATELRSSVSPYRSAGGGEENGEGLKNTPAATAHTQTHTHRTKLHFTSTSITCLEVSTASIAASLDVASEPGGRPSLAAPTQDARHTATHWLHCLQKE